MGDEICTLAFSCSHLHELYAPQRDLVDLACADLIKYDL